jgi:hypothetical protein
MRSKASREAIATLSTIIYFPPTLKKMYGQSWAKESKVRYTKIIQECLSEVQSHPLNKAPPVAIMD